MVEVGRRSLSTVFVYSPERRRVLGVPGEVESTSFKVWDE